ncbi:MAG: NRDE family protein [Actinobacteria bacterium]|nr:MAG: NRDE family protein [Actinomycetota bacterium]
MCLLVAISRDRDESPLIVAANRDELLDRPAVAMTVLQAHGPRILGGRDELAGGTWLAVNEAGVVAGLPTAATPPSGPGGSCPWPWLEARTHPPRWSASSPR